MSKSTKNQEDFYIESQSREVPGQFIKLQPTTEITTTRTTTITPTSDDPDYNYGVDRDQFYNRYATKKTFSNGLLDGALLATNAAQLRQLLSDGLFDKKDPIWYVSIALVSSSMIAQVVTLILLAVLANYNLANRNKAKFLDYLNNFVLVLTGIIFCLNVIVNVFVQIDVTDLLNRITTLQAPQSPQSPMFWSTTPPAIY